MPLALPNFLLSSWRWYSQLKWESRYMPRYLTWSTGLNLIPLNLMEIELKSTGRRFEWKNISSVFAVLRDSLLRPSHLITCFNSVLIMVSMVFSFLLLYIIKVSSAKWPQLVLSRQSLKSLIYNKNNNVPSDDPW